MYKHSA
jgi:hypothetical protein